MSTSTEDKTSPNTQLSSQFFGDILDCIIVDVASEYHRIAKLGIDGNVEQQEEELRLSAEAYADPNNWSETKSGYDFDIFGQAHPAVANDLIKCMNCRRRLVAGKFASHLESCMGKGRKASRRSKRIKNAVKIR